MSSLSPPLKPYEATDERLDEDIAYLIDSLGIPQDSVMASSETLETYGPRVPKLLLRLWSKYGFGLWKFGLFQLCDPSRYQSLLDILLSGNSTFPPNECALFGYTAFGELSVWHPQQGSLIIDCVRCRGKFEDPERKRYDPNIELMGFLMFLPETYDSFEHFNEAAIEKLGPLKRDECYGFVPAIGLGGQGILSELKKHRALEHFAFLGQIQPIEYYYTKFPIIKQIIND